MARRKNPVNGCLEAQCLRVQHALVHLPCVCKRKTLKPHRERRRGRLRWAYRRRSIKAHRPIKFGRYLIGRWEDKIDQIIDRSGSLRSSLNHYEREARRIVRKNKRRREDPAAPELPKGICALSGEKLESAQLLHVSLASTSPTNQEVVSLTSCGLASSPLVYQPHIKNSALG